MMNGIDQDRFLPPPGLNTLLTEASGYCSVSGHTLIVASLGSSFMGDRWRATKARVARARSVSVRRRPRMNQWRARELLRFIINRILRL